MAIQSAAVQRQHQVQGMIPEHILGKAVLKMTIQELKQFVEAQVAENPALSLDEGNLCPICGAELGGDCCESCGTQVASDDTSDIEPTHELSNDQWTNCIPADEMPDPMWPVAAPSSLVDYVKEQIPANLPQDMVQAAQLLADFLDEDGYIREPLVDIGRELGMSAPQVEAVLLQMQTLDPPGIAARDLRECLLIQLRRLDEMSDAENSFDSADRFVAEKMIREHWHSFCRVKLDKIAEQMGVPRDAVESALRFIRRNLNPRPANVYRDPWEKYTPRKTPRTIPEIIVDRVSDNFVVRIANPFSTRLGVDEMYASLYTEIGHRKSRLDVGDISHVRECVRRARALIQALEFRNATLYKLANELIRCQKSFLEEGLVEVKPITQKELARRLRVHESTICRAAAGKRMQLPSGEVVPLEIFFDASVPVKELVRRFAAERLTDSQIAERLRQYGINIARRTVAKYRSELHLPSVEYRMVA